VWVGNVVVAGAGAAGEYALEGGKGAKEVSERAWAAQHDANRVRASDYSAIGMLLGSLLTPAVLWKRAPRVHLILGGAVLGEGVGWGVHLWQRFVEPSLVGGAGSGEGAVKVEREAQKQPGESAVDRVDAVPPRTPLGPAPTETPEGAVVNVVPEKQTPGQAVDRVEGADVRKLGKAGGEGVK